MFRVSTVPDIDRFAGDTWPGLPEASFYSSPGWLRCARAATGGQVGAVLVHDGDHLVAVAPFWLTTGRENASRTPARVLSDVGVRGRSFLVAGTSTAFLSELVAASPDARYRAAPLVIDRLRSLARLYDVDGCLALYADERSTEAYLAATPGRVGVLLDAEAVLPVPAAFDEFPIGVSGQRRKKFHKEWRIFTEAGYDLGIEHLADCAEEFAALTGQLERKHGNDFDEPGMLNALRVQAKLCGSADLVFCARRGGRLIAASLCYQAGDTLIVRSFGMDYEGAETPYDYFALVYYLPIRYAIEHGLRSVSVGISTTGAKVHRGARLGKLWAVDLNERPLWEPEAAARMNLETSAELPQLAAITDR